MLLNILLIIVMIGLVGILFLPRLRQSDYWHATVTPLASIIGSGFLVVAPLLGYAVGAWAPLAMFSIVLLAYAIGAVMRFNIRHLEPLMNDDHPYTRIIERLSNISLAAAYLISVAFYVRLLASFLLHPLELETADWMANMITTVILVGIGIAGVLRGLHGLEWLEEAAVNIKLGIIAALLLGLAWYDTAWLGGDRTLEVQPIEDGLHALRLLAGMLLVVQGFETSRYLADSYGADLRQRTMRHAQWIAGGVYILFVLLALPLLGPYAEAPSETAIINISGQVAAVLPVMLLVAAIMSQLSAAVADTVGSGGMFAEASGHRVSEKAGYALVVMLAILLVWLVDIFGIIAIASRAFAIYYLVQCAAAWMAADAIDSRPARLALRSGFLILGCVLLLVAIFAIPAEAAK